MRGDPDELPCFIPKLLSPVGVRRYPGYPVLFRRKCAGRAFASSVLFPPTQRHSTVIANANLFTCEQRRKSVRVRQRMGAIAICDQNVQKVTAIALCRAHAVTDEIAKKRVAVIRISPGLPSAFRFGRCVMRRSRLPGKRAVPMEPRSGPWGSTRLSRRRLDGAILSLNAAL